jgi:hypothetical protein
MPVAEPLSPIAEDLWRTLAEPGEQVVLTAASDVRADGSYGQRWVVVTDRRVVVLPDGASHNGRVASTNGHVHGSDLGGPMPEVGPGSQTSDP